MTDGPLTAEESTRLSELLRDDPAAQEAYLDHVMMDALLEREFGGVAPAVTRSEAIASRDVVVRGPWRRFRSMAKMAAALFVGAFLASAVWAYALPRVSAAKRVRLPIGDGSFENGGAPGQDGVPVRPGVWGGDFSRVVDAEQGVQPHEGRRMLRLVSADNSQTPAGAPRRAAELWQVVDVRPMRGLLGRGPAAVEVSAFFKAVPPAIKDRFVYGLAIYAFHGDPVSGPEAWKMRRELALAGMDKEESAESVAAQWRPLAAQITVPPDADFLLVQARFVCKTPGPLTTPVEFAGHYLDDFALHVVLPPRP